MLRPPLLVQYTAASGRPTSSPCELMLTMRPPRPAAAIVRATAWLMKNTPRRFTAIISSQSASVTSKAARAKPRPALLTSTSMRAVRRDDGRDGFGNRGDVAHVQPLGVHGHTARLRLGGEVGKVGVRAYGRHDDRTGLGEQDGQFAPDSLRRAGDDDDAPAEIEAPRGVVVAARQRITPSWKVAIAQQRPYRVRRSALRDELGHSLEVGIRARELAHDPAAREHDDFVGYRQRLLQIVHDQHDGLAGVPRAPDLIEHLLGLADGECSSRLVEDQATRAVDDGPRDRDGLLLAAGQRRRGSLSRRRRSTPSVASASLAIRSAAFAS